jgi:hypothetical protein
MKRPAPLAAVRLVAEGTRVVVLKGTAPYATGVVSQVRAEINLKSYVVTCDDGQVIFASSYDLAREEDATAQPLGRRPASD